MSVERDAVFQLLEDVEILEAQIGPLQVPRPSHIRATFSPILRRWILDGLYHIVQKNVNPHEIKFEIIPSGPAVKSAKAGLLDHWMAAVQFGPTLISVGQPKARYVGARGMPTIPIETGQNQAAFPQKAGIFFEQRVLFLNEVFYTRSDLIKLQANKLGGVHLDLRRGLSDAHITRIENYFGYEIKGNIRNMLVGPELTIGRSDINRRQNIYNVLDLFTLDTARIFCRAIRENQAVLRKLL